MHDLRGNFFIDGRRRRQKKRRKGEGKRGNEGERGGKGGGEKGEWHREDGGNEAENTHKENTEKAQRERKAQGRRKKGRKDDKEEEVPGRKARKENIGHVSGAVHKREIKGMGKGCKKGGGTETRKTDTTGTEAHTRKAWNTQWNNGTNWNGKMEGAARIAKRRRHRNRGHTQGKHGRRTRSHT